MILSVLPFIQFLMIILLPSCSKEIEYISPNSNTNPDHVIIQDSTSRFYKEFIVEMKDGNNWRVTDPNTTYSGKSEEQPYNYLPNPVLEIQDIALKNAIRAEAIIDRWGGHTGTSGHQIRFNNNSWIDLPIHLEGAPTNPEWYNFQDNPIVEVPLKYLVNGVNKLEGTSGPQTKYANTWGQWGWYSLILRVYYFYETDIQANFLNIADGGTLSENPDISVSVNNPDEVEKIVFQGIYEGPDEDGDGEYYDLHGMYHYSNLQGIIGEATHQPFQVTWNTEWIPDQTKDLQLVAKVQLKNGFCFLTDTLKGIKFKRNSSSVKMFCAENVPEKFWVRNKNVSRCNFTIPESESLEKAVEVKMFIRTWNGLNNDEYGTPFKINNSDWMKFEGASHNFDFRMVDIPLGLIKNGLNTITITSSTVHHGCEILWPGPTILVKYIK